MTHRVVVIGKNLLAVGCLETVARYDEVVLAVADPGDTGADGWQPSFRAAAERQGIPVAAPPSVNADAFVEEVRVLAPDFLLSFQAPQILRRPLIQSAGRATLNLHFGPLPRYRGVAPIAWALINGESETGVTIHHIDPGIDSGQLVRAATVPITDDDTGRSLYDRCTDAGIALFAAEWPSLRDGDLEGRPQSDADALYYNRHSIDFSRRRISWSADARRVADWTRAFIFPPFQYPTIGYDGEEYEVRGVRWDRGAHRERPGTILDLVDDALLVAAAGGRLSLGPIARASELLAGSALAARFAAGTPLE